MAGPMWADKSLDAAHSIARRAALWFIDIKNSERCHGVVIVGGKSGMSRRTIIKEHLGGTLGGFATGVGEWNVVRHALRGFRACHPYGPPTIFGFLYVAAADVIVSRI